MVDGHQVVRGEQQQEGGRDGTAEPESQNLKGPKRLFFLTAFFSYPINETRIAEGKGDLLG